MTLLSGDTVEEVLSIAMESLVFGALWSMQKKSCQSVTQSSWVRKRLKQVALFINAADSTSSEVIDFDEFMSSTSGHSTPTMMCWMKKTTNAISDTGRKESVQVALLQTHGEDGAYLLMLLGSLIGVLSVHFWLMCSARKTSFSSISQTPQLMGDRWNLSVPTRPSRCTSLRSNQFWVANHDFFKCFWKRSWIA